MQCLKKLCIFAIQNMSSEDYDQTAQMHRLTASLVDARWKIGFLMLKLICTESCIP